MAKIDFTAMKNNRKAIEDRVEDNIPEELEKTYTDVWGSNGEKIVCIETSRIKPYIDEAGDGQPFKLNEKKVNQICASAADIGILTPLRVRPKGNNYEVVSGHHRLEAAKRLNLLKVPCIIKEYSEEEVFQILTESNIQRDRTLPSEYGRIFTRYMELRSDIDMTAEEIAAKFDVSKKTMYRYLNVSKLIPELQELADNDIINIGAVDSISSVSESVQELLYLVLTDNGRKVSVATGKALKSLSDELGEEIAESDIQSLFESPKAQKKRSISTKLVNKYFSADTSDEEIEDIMDKALAEYCKKNG